MSASPSTPSRPPRTRPRAESELKPPDAALPAVDDPDTIAGFSGPAVEIFVTQGICVPFAVPDGASMSRAQAITAVARELTRACDALRIDERRKTDGSPMKSKGWVDTAVSKDGIIARMGGAAWDNVLPILDDPAIRPAWSDAAVDGLAQGIAHRWTKLTTTGKGAAIDLLNGLESIRISGSASKLRDKLRDDVVAAQAFSDGNAGFAALDKVHPSNTAVFAQHVLVIILSLIILVSLGYLVYTGEAVGITQQLVSTLGLDKALGIVIQTSN